MMEQNQPSNLSYYNKGLRGLSHSRLSMLQSCPKQYSLTKYKSLFQKESNATFSYGHAIGAVVQSLLAGKSKDRAVLDGMLAYTYEGNELTSGEISSKKDFWSMVKAAKLLTDSWESQLTVLNGWEVVEFRHPTTGKKLNGIELSFVVDLGEGFTWEGHIDVVLVNKAKKLLKVIEVKTNGSYSAHEAQYCNSSQPLGYLVVLHTIAEQLGLDASFEVLYMVFMSKKLELLLMPTKKTVLMQVRFLNDLLNYMDLVKHYEQVGFPRHGGSCYAFSRPCRFYDVCNAPSQQLEDINTELSSARTQEAYATSLGENSIFYTMEDLIKTHQHLVSRHEEAPQESYLSDDVTIQLGII